MHAIIRYKLSKCKICTKLIMKLVFQRTPMIYKTLSINQAKNHKEKYLR